MRLLKLSWEATVFLLNHSTRNIWGRGTSKPTTASRTASTVKTAKVVNNETRNDGRQTPKQR